MTSIYISTAQTLICDSARIDSLRNCGDFDYNSELMHISQPSILERILDSIHSCLRSLLYNPTGSGEYSWIWYLITVTLVVIAFFVLRRKYPQFFMRDSKETLDYEVVDDNIYEIDFDKQIEKCLKKNNYREACRYLYLKTLYSLTEKNRIDWQPNKTPTQFTREERSSEFRRMTNIFLRVRYGNFEATSATYDDMLSLSEAIDQLPYIEVEEGGDA